MTHAYTIRQVCETLQLSRSAFFARRAQLVRQGLLVEALPRIDRSPRYLPGPIDDYLSGATRKTVLRQVIGGR